MKNSTTRRSFLKKSTIGALVLANVSLLSGLVSAEQSSGLFEGCNPPGCGLPQDKATGWCVRNCVPGPHYPPGQTCSF